jgi:type II secretory pathway component PulF
MSKGYLNALPDINQLANLYTQLARMETAGIAHVQAFKNLIETGSTLNSKFARMIKFLQAGHSIADSGYRCLIFKEVDRDLIAAGEYSGKLGDIYQQLANYYSDKSKRLRKIKSRLLLPLAILFLAILIQPIPALFVGSITLLDYILVSFGKFAGIMLILYCIWRLPYWLTEGLLCKLGLRQIVYQLQLTLPFIAPWVIRRQIREFLLVLGMMLDAGVPILEAFPKAAGTIKNVLLAERFKKAGNSLQAGDNLFKVIKQIKGFSHSSRQLIATGEQSGKLAETLLHFAELEGEAISLQEEMLAVWVPTLIYTTITIWIGYAIIASYVNYFSNLEQTIGNIH